MAPRSRSYSASILATKSSDTPTSYRELPLIDHRVPDPAETASSKERSLRRCDEGRRQSLAPGAVACSPQTV